MESRRAFEISRRELVAGAAALVVSLPFAGLAFADQKEEKKEDAEKPAEEKTEIKKVDTKGLDLKLLKEGTLVVATSPDYPPFENIEDDKYVGLDMELISTIAEMLDLKVEFKTIQFDGIIPAIAAGGQADVGISAFSIDPERAKEINFTEPYYIDDIAIVTMKDNKDITKENVAKALNDSKIIIAAQSGTTGEDFARETFPDATTKGYGNATDCFAAMQAGQADAVCTNDAVAKKTVKDFYTDAQIVKEIATGEEYAAIVSKENEDLLKAINEALKILKEDGYFDKLANKYLS